MALSVVAVALAGGRVFASVNEEDEALESLSHQTWPDRGCCTARISNKVVWSVESASVPRNICFLRHLPEAKVPTAVLVGEVERGRIAVVSENAGHILGPEAD